MCVSPIKIPNTRNNYRVGVDKLYQLVRCNQCEECIKQNQEDWFVRLSYEYKHYTQELNGCVLFPTLTYNEFNVPILDTSDTSFDWLRYKCEKYGTLPLVRHRGFCKDDVKSFIRKFKTYLERAGYPCADVKYFIVSEYGGETARPHYHVILFLPFRSLSKNVYDLVFANEIKKILQKAWSKEVKFVDLPLHIQNSILADERKFAPGTERTYGHVGEYHVTLTNRKRKKFTDRLSVLLELGFVNYPVDESNNIIPYVESIKGINYILKYVHKDSRFMRSLACQEDTEIIDMLSGEITLGKQTYKYIDNNGEEKERPFYIQDLHWYVQNLPSPSELEEEAKKMKKWFDENHLPTDDVYDRLLFEAKTIKQLRDFLPFHLQSQNLGRTILEELNIDNLDGEDYLKARHYLVNGTFKPLDMKSVYRIPQYIINRIFYQFEPSTHFDGKMVRNITPIGLEVLKERQQISINDVSQVFRKTLTIDKVKALRDDELLTFENTYKVSLPKLADKILKTFPDFSPLAIYRMTLQDVIVEHPEDWYWNSREAILQYGLDLDKYKIDTNNVQYLGQYNASSFIRLNKSYKLTCFNDLEQFKDFDLYLSAIDYIKTCISKRRCEKFAKDRAKARQVREVNNKFKYY